MPYRRMTRRTEIARKMAILHNVCGVTSETPGYYDKGKISCSCRKCRAMRIHYSPSVSEKREIDRMNSSLESFLTETEAC